MYRNIDVMTEMRKLTDSKPVHAVAGAGVLASQTLKDLPGLLVRWGTENPVTSLPSRATGYAQTAQTRATSAAQTAQARARPAARADGPGPRQRGRADGARQGRRRLRHAGRARQEGPERAAAHRPGQEHPAQEHRSAAPGKAALNGKAKGKAPSRPSTGH